MSEQTQKFKCLAHVVRIKNGQSYFDFTLYFAFFISYSFSLIIIIVVLLLHRISGVFVFSQRCIFVDQKTKIAEKIRQTSIRMNVPRMCLHTQLHVHMPAARLMLYNTALLLLWVQYVCNLSVISLSSLLFFCCLSHCMHASSF